MDIVPAYLIFTIVIGIIAANRWGWRGGGGVKYLATYALLAAIPWVYVYLDSQALVPVWLSFRDNFEFTDDLEDETFFAVANGALAAMSHLSIWLLLPVEASVSAGESEK
jgi:hypothetical protein